MSRVIFPLIVVLVLIAIPILGIKVAGLHMLFGVVVPYAAFAIFVIGFIWRVIYWAQSPVPFRIPTTAGQQRSLPWFKQSRWDNPFTTGEVVVRMALEVLCFRSLFRNKRIDFRQLPDGTPILRYSPTKWLWAFALLFHWSFLIILIRHIRLATVPIPGPIEFLDHLDCIFEIGVPQLYMTDLTILAGLLFLLCRRLFIPQLRYISLPADYFPLFLIISIVCSGMLMRYFLRTDIVGVKELVMGLVSFHPHAPAKDISTIFFVHIFLVSCLFAYFPFSKLMHMGGVFLSPTRNMANNNRYKRHINPWNYPVKTHPYEEYEEEFREFMKQAGIPVEKE